MDSQYIYCSYFNQYGRDIVKMKRKDYLDKFGADSLNKM